MIESMESALRFYGEREEEFRSFGSAILKLRNGPLDGLDEVVNALGLPKSYAQCADEIRMEGVSLGFFDLSPGDTKDLCRSLHVLNGAARNPSLPMNLLSVAAFDADIIAVSSGEPYHPNGMVHYIDITTSSTPRINAIADSFSDFIVFASALDQAVLEGHGDPGLVVSELASRLGSEEYAEKWQIIAGMVV